MTAPLAAAGLLGVLADLSGTGRTSGGEAILFWVLAPVIVLAALGLVVVRRAVHAVLCVVVVMVSLAVLYVAQDAPFLGVVQVIVYTGAVMMLFLFVMMLVGVDRSESFTETLAGQRWAAALLGLGLGSVLVGVMMTAGGMKPAGFAIGESDSNPGGVAEVILRDFVFDLEVVGVLLITAAVGAMVLTHRPRLTRKAGQRERAGARVLTGGVLAPLPVPGVYARSNAADVAALGADGRPLGQSVPRVLRVRGQERAIAEVHARIDDDAPPSQVSATAGEEQAQ